MSRQSSTGGASDDVSARTSKKRLIAVGKLVRTHGIRGELKLMPYFDDVLFDLVGEIFTVKPEKRGLPARLRLSSLRGAGVTIIAKFEGITTPDEAKPLVSQTVYIERGLMPDLPPGEFYYEEIIGLPVFDEAGKRLGELVEFFPAGEKDVWVIKTPDKDEILIPYIDETVKLVDPENRRIVVCLMEWE